jgi:hypothetical protein
MSPDEEFRQTCLLQGANNCAAIEGLQGPAAVRHAIMIVAYMLAACALRRNGLAHRVLRSSNHRPAHPSPFQLVKPHAPIFAPLRFAGFSIQPPMKRRLAIAFQ